MDFELSRTAPKSWGMAPFAVAADSRITGAVSLQMPWTAAFETNSLAYAISCKMSVLCTIKALLNLYFDMSLYDMPFEIVQETIFCQFVQVTFFVNDNSHCCGSVLICACFDSTWVRVRYIFGVQKLT